MKAAAGFAFQRWMSVAALRRLAAPRAVPAATRPGSRQLLVDVSTIARRDAGTGIQRVVKAVLNELAKAPPPGYEVRPVRASRWRGYRHAAGRQPLEVAAGDVFLALDLTAHILPRHLAQLARWKQAGVRVHFVVYDLLPAQHPEWFTARAARNYRRWARSLAVLADGALCTTRATAHELRGWLRQQFGAPTESIPIGWFHLGADLESGAAAAAAGGDEAALVRLGGRPSVLMVGTVEPRKGQAQALSAFEELWRAGEDVNLVIVGRVGWRVDALVRRLRAHAELGAKLHWFDDASDDTLRRLYQAAAGLLVASEAEGFGLPVIEAARYGKPLLLRDIPVFREVAGAHATFFSAATAAGLARDIARWLGQIRSGEAPGSSRLGPLTWRESAQALARQILT